MRNLRLKSVDRLFCTFEWCCLPIIAITGHKPPPWNDFSCMCMPLCKWFCLRLINSVHYKLVRFHPWVLTFWCVNRGDLWALVTDLLQINAIFLLLHCCLTKHFAHQMVAMVVNMSLMAPTSMATPVFLQQCVRADIQRESIRDRWIHLTQDQ